MTYSIKKQAYSLILESDRHSLSIIGGNFGALKLEHAPMFELTLENPTDKSERKIGSGSHWESVNVLQNGDWLRISLNNPEGLGDITLVYTAMADESGISWYGEVINDSEVYSVGAVSYPQIKVSGKPLNMFAPVHSGRYYRDCTHARMGYVWSYPSYDCPMQYYAYDTDGGGVYLGVHDAKGSIKTFDYAVSDGCGQLKVVLPAINAGRVANSFELAGYMRWQAYDGDWYDASMIYADFVYKHAEWLPKITENGRPDTADKFKEITFWIADYIPNSPAQRDAKPMILGAVSDKYDKNYWFEAPIELKKRLGVPVAYQVYNWHEIPFNINYPHYTPARDEYFRGIDALKAAGIYVMPYINAASWEEHDADEGFGINFGNTGKYGAATAKSGDFYRYPYPQKKLDGKETQLIPMCPTSPDWRRIITRESREIERTMQVDGIYFDQIASMKAHDCRSEKHAHLPGGGSYWAEGYNLLMSKVRHKKPSEAFYFTEDAAEPYMKSFDGYLTWTWHESKEVAVPAYPAIYAGYIQMLGTFTDGANREDDLYFRYNLVKSLNYGQQLGWVNAEVVYKEGRMKLLEPVARLRYRYTRLFNCGKLLRPPKVSCELEAARSSGCTMEMTAAGAWQYRDRSETVIFVSNIADRPCKCELTFDYAEYGLTADKLPEGFTAEGTTAHATLTLEPCSARAISIK